MSMAQFQIWHKTPAFSGITLPTNKGFCICSVVCATPQLSEMGCTGH
jgi:hypothetical protein